MNSRKKGIRGELIAVKMLRRWFPECKRSFGQSRFGYEQPDIIGGGIEKEFFVEVKYQSAALCRPTNLQKQYAKANDDRGKYIDLGGQTGSLLFMYKDTDHPRSPWRVRFGVIIKEELRFGGNDIEWSRFSKRMDQMYEVHE